MTDPNRAPHRRTFLTTSAALGASAAVVPAWGNASEIRQEERFQFNLKFAPHPGSFRPLSGDDLIDQIRFFHDQGFTAMEFNGLPRETPETQEKIGQTLSELGMTMGVFVGFANFVEPIFAEPHPDTTEQVLSAIRESIEIAKRVNARWFTVVPGSIDQQPPGKEGNAYGKAILAPGYQMANVVELLRRCTELLEPHELVMVLEPLNWHTNHGGAYLRYSDQAYAICKAVDSPSCKILFDIYHQQITEGNLIPNIDRCWDEIAYFQAGDNPGRKEPGTGEINYANVFQHIHDKARADQRDFVIGMEHGASGRGKEGAQAVIDAYRAVNPKS